MALGMPAGIAATENFVYVANEGDGRVDIIAALPPNELSSFVQVGAAPFGVAIDPSGAFVFVGNSGVTAVSVIEIATINTPSPVVVSVPVGAAPLVFGAFVAGAPPSTPPSPSCKDKIADLQKQVSKLGRRHGPAWLKAAIHARAAAEYELNLAMKKVGGNDSRYLRAMKEFKDGDADLCKGRYRHAKHEFWEAFDIAHKILRHYHRR
jgi:hypothetical protein